MNNDITYTKAIGIMLMVFCHALFWDIPFIYMFHMPLFYFFSGYCLKDKYLENPCKFVWRKIKGIWLPYIKYSLLFLAFHNVFFHLNIYNGSYGFNGRTSCLYSKLDFIQHFENIVIRMQGNEQLLGGFWFLKSLFWGNLIAFSVIYILSLISKRLKLEEWCCALIGGRFSYSFV